MVFENRYAPDAQLEADLASYEHTMTAFGESARKTALPPKIRPLLQPNL